jgi:hypothetical protein
VFRLAMLERSYQTNSSQPILPIATKVSTKVNLV